MSINLRHVGAELHQALKVRAAEENVTLESLCVRFLWQGLDQKGSGIGRSGAPAPAVVDGAADNREGQSSRVTTPESGDDLKAVRIRPDPPSRPAHAPGCRCLMCGK